MGARGRACHWPSLPLYWMRASADTSLHTQGRRRRISRSLDRPIAGQELRLRKQEGTGESICCSTGLSQLVRIFLCSKRAERPGPAVGH